MTMDSEYIDETLETLKRDAEAIESNMGDLCIYSKGSITYTDAKNMSSLERSNMMEKLNEMLSATSGTEYL